MGVIGTWCRLQSDEGVLLRQAKFKMSKDETAATGTGRSNKSGTKPVLDRQVQVHIGRKLKAVYDEVAAEPLPKEILDLLAKLESRSKE